MVILQLPFSLATRMKPPTRWIALGVCTATTTLAVFIYFSPYFCEEVRLLDLSSRAGHREAPKYTKRCKEWWEIIAVIAVHFVVGVCYVIAAAAGAVIGAPVLFLLSPIIVLVWLFPLLKESPWAVVALVWIFYVKRPIV